jgi:hypothetical protein
MNNNEKEALRWYLQGTRDARTAGRNSRNGDFEVACFLYLQAAEKACRAFDEVHAVVRIDLDPLTENTDRT